MSRDWVHNLLSLPTFKTRPRSGSFLRIIQVWHRGRTGVHREVVLNALHRLSYQVLLRYYLFLWSTPKNSSGCCFQHYILRSQGPVRVRKTSCLDKWYVFTEVSYTVVQDCLSLPLYPVMLWHVILYEQYSILDNIGVLVFCFVHMVIQCLLSLKI